MRYYAKEEQWAMLSEGNKKLIFKHLIDNGKVIEYKTLSISQAIEYLGRDLSSIQRKVDNSYSVFIQLQGDKMSAEYFHDEELIDALWRACLYKLSKKICRLN